jgi:hypothetical protein
MPATHANSDASEFLKRSASFVAASPAYSAIRNGRVIAFRYRAMTDDKGTVIAGVSIYVETWQNEG